MNDSVKTSPLKVVQATYRVLFEISKASALFVNCLQIDNKEGSYELYNSLLFNCRGDLTRTDDPLHPMQVR